MVQYIKQHRRNVERIEKIFFSEIREPKTPPHTNMYSEKYIHLAHLELRNGFPFLMNESFIVIRRVFYFLSLRMLRYRTNSDAIRVGYHRKDLIEANKCLIRIRSLHRAVETRKSELITHVRNLGASSRKQ